MRVPIGTCPMVGYKAVLIKLCENREYLMTVLMTGKTVMRSYNLRLTHSKNFERIRKCLNVSKHVRHFLLNHLITAVSLRT